MSKRQPGDKLTHSFVKSVTKAGRYGDGRGGHGLTLLVQPTKNGGRSKTWAQRLYIGKARQQYTPGLGSWPLVTLADVRDKALENARLVKQGVDIRKPAAHVPTLKEAFEIVIALREPGWRGKQTKASWTISLEHCEQIASMPVSEVTPADVLKILTPLWHARGATADKLLSHLHSVMDWSITQGHRTTNPAAHSITSTLSKRPSAVHHKHLAYPLMGEALATIRDSNAWWSERCCLLLLAFTGLRSGELRKATWDEIDWANSTLTVPADHMKAGIEHRVPLSTQALETLHHAREQSGCSEGIIFPNQHGSQYITGRSLTKLLRTLHVESVPHGFRSSIRTWAAKETDLPEPAAEMLLAHTPSSAVVKAYQTYDFYEHRQPAMQQWADFLTQTMGAVISTTPGASRKTQQERKEEANSPVRTSKAETKKTFQAIMPGWANYMTTGVVERT